VCRNRYRRQAPRELEGVAAELGTSIPGQRRAGGHDGWLGLSLMRTSGDVLEPEEGSQLSQRVAGVAIVDDRSTEAERLPRDCSRAPDDPDVAEGVS